MARAVLATATLFLGMVHARLIRPSEACYNVDRESEAIGATPPKTIDSLT